MVTVVSSHRGDFIEDACSSVFQQFVFPQQDRTGLLLCHCVGRHFTVVRERSVSFPGLLKGGEEAVLKFSRFLTDTTQTSLCPASPVAACALMVFDGVLAFCPRRRPGSLGAAPRALWPPLPQPCAHTPPAALRASVGTLPQPHRVWSRGM